MRNTRGKSDWIWIGNESAEDRDQVRVVFFRKEICLSKVPASYPVRISASSRYKLYVNGTFVQAGPAKGCREYGYWDPAELSPCLRTGTNVVSLEVLRYPENSKKRNDSLVHTEYPGLYLLDETEEELLRVQEGWRCRKAGHIRLEAEIFQPAPIHARETVEASAECFGWKEAGYDDTSWESPEVYSLRDGTSAFSPFAMKKREIPGMLGESARFEAVVCCREAADPEEAVRMWNPLIISGETLVIPPHTRQVMELTAGAMACGYPIWKLAKGAGARITTMCAESYVLPDPEGAPKFPFPRKGDRADYVNGYIHGNPETYQVTGEGSASYPEVYEPYWFKTFQYVQVTVETGDEELQILDFSYRTSRYPLEIRTDVQASDPTFKDIWEMCARTLKLCMHETYVDCPYYEQLQYVMDARTEILTTYTTSADDRLARQCMEAFRCSAQNNGILRASAPTEWVNVIPGFSLYYILMVHDHMMYFGDKSLVKHHMNCINGILDFFESNLTDLGLVGKIGGLLYEEPYWSFVDWTREWGRSKGVPTATLKGTGSLTIESLYYLYGLQTAAELAEFLGRPEQAADYRRRGEEVKEALRKWCFGANGLIQDGPGIDEYSTHCQLFAVLTDLVDAEQGWKILDGSIGQDGVAQCSFSMCFYLFRALEKVGHYDKVSEMWDMWRGMLANHMTTCAESPMGGRSDCHGWSALLLYELPAVYLGVKPAEPGFGKVSVKPIPGHLTEASGDLVTPKGLIHVEWKKNSVEEEPQVMMTLPEGMELV